MEGIPVMAPNNTLSHHLIISVSDDSSILLDCFFIRYSTRELAGSITAEGETINRDFAGGFHNHSSNIKVRSCPFCQLPAQVQMDSVKTSLFDVYDTDSMIKRNLLDFSSPNYWLQSLQNLYDLSTGNTST
jgi:hypothetical protein